MSMEETKLQQVEASIDTFNRYTLKEIDCEREYSRILEIEEELRAITARIGAELKIITFISPKYETVAAETYIGKLYRHDHFFNGAEQLRETHSPTKEPKEVNFYGIPHSKRYVT